MLAQTTDDANQYQAVAYASRTLSDTETRHFKPYIYMSKIILHTDHRPLKYILAKQKVHERVARWLIELQQYDIEIRHIDGKRNTVADCLSRAKDEIAPLPEEELQDIVEFPVCMAVGSSRNRVPSRFTQAGTQKPIDIALEQDKDKDIGVIKRFLEKPTSPIDDISSQWVP
uniref:RT_RNaseH domain-containing protein n=1 Tax=Caenorhabditis japonica TaxID=281687 RepID=A0A8R1HME7_CAEJA